jgi:hypothetical protein
MTPAGAEALVGVFYFYGERDMNKTLMLLIQLQNLVLGGDGRVEGRIDCLRSYIPRNHLARFDNLLNHGRPAVAMLTDTGACWGCHFRPSSAASWTILAGRDHIHVCQYCGCFLYPRTFSRFP